MQVVQATFGVFHHFDLARELETRGLLKRIYSSFPWKRLKREGVPRRLVKTFPWFHTPLILLGRTVHVPPELNLTLGQWNAAAYDAWLCTQDLEGDAYIALSGCGARSGRRAQRMGAKYVCDRGSAHIRYQKTILEEESARWGFEGMRVHPWNVDREEMEYAEADVITIPSEFARQTFIELGVNPQKIRKTPYGVRLDRFRRTASPATNSFDVLFAGNITLQKGIPYLLEAFAKLNHPLKKLRLAGTIDDQMRALLPRFDLTNVEFLGPLPQPELAQWMSRSHVLVLPSIQDGFGMVMAQAMACGTPVIASDHTGGADLFTDRVEGFMVPIRSPEAITERLLWLADDPAMQQRMSEAALKRVQSLGGWHDYGEQYAALLKDITGQTSSAQA